MVRSIPLIAGARDCFSTRVSAAVALFVSILLLMALCAKHWRLISKNQASETSDPSTPDKNSSPESESEEIGVWQKAILMGEKCRAPEFPGVIYYDSAGNRVLAMPRSPRAGGPFRDFRFPAEVMDGKN